MLKLPVSPVSPCAASIPLVTINSPTKMKAYQLFLALLQLTPILAQFKFHCITNEDEFNAEGWSSLATIKFATTERDLPLVFQDQMTAADGIFYLSGDGIDLFMTIDSPVSLNLQPPVNMYIRYYAHVPVIAGQGLVVYPDPDSGTKDLTLESDFKWRNESIQIDEQSANADVIAIFFQNAQVGDFLLIDSLIITEGATLSEEEMVSLCSPATSPMPTYTPATPGSTTDAAITSVTTPIPPSRPCVIECIGAAEDFESNGWLSFPSYTYAKDSASLPDAFKHLSGSGIFYFEGGVNSFLILREMFASNRTCDDAYLYIKYCTFTNESSNSKLEVSPAGFNPGGVAVQQLPLTMEVAWKEILLILKGFREYVEIRGQGFIANEYILFDKIGLVAADTLADILENIAQCAWRLDLCVSSTGSTISKLVLH